MQRMSILCNSASRLVIFCPMLLDRINNIFLYGSPYDLKEHKMFYGHRMLSSTLLFKNAPSIRRAMHIYTFDFAYATLFYHRVQVWWTIQDILWHVYCTVFGEISRCTTCKHKIANILRCTLWALSKHAKTYDELRIFLNEDQALIMLTAGSLYSILILQIGWQFCDGIKLADCCQSGYKYIHWEII